MLIAAACFLSPGGATLPSAPAIVGVGALGLISIGIAAYLGKTISRSVTNLAGSVRQIRTGESQTLEISARSNDEFGELVTEFNLVFGQLSMRTLELESANRELTERIGEYVGRLKQEIDLRRIAQEEAIQSSHSVHDFFDNASVSLHWLSPEGIVIRANRAELNMLGYQPDEFIGHPIAEFQTDPGRIEELLAKASAGESLHGYELEMRCRNGQVRYVSIDSDAIWEHGKFVQVRCFVRDLTNQKEAERALVARERAERANTAKSEFLSRMSHELRTPMNSILGFGQLLEMEDLTPNQREFVDHIVASGTNLLGLINEVLDISRLESGHMTIARESVDLELEIAEVVSLVRPLANSRSVSIEIDVESTRGMRVYGDSQRLGQVLLNLLSNAIKYNREAGTVRVQAVDSGESVRIRIIDDGPGISLARRRDLFMPFERLGAEHTGISGTGLGLVLSKRLVEAMKGEIGIEDQERGATFYVELQSAPAASLSETLTASLKRNANCTGSQTVLLIEDNLSNMNLIEKILASRPNIRLITAMHGTMGIELARQHSPNLILLDLNLPDMHGEQVLTELRANHGTRDIPVAVVSADATPTQIDRLKSMGVLSYITKPINVRTFMTLVDGTLAGNLEQKSA